MSNGLRGALGVSENDNATDERDDVAQVQKQFDIVKALVKSLRADMARVAAIGKLPNPDVFYKTPVATLKATKEAYKLAQRINKDLLNKGIRAHIGEYSAKTPKGKALRTEYQAMMSQVTDDWFKYDVYRIGQNRMAGNLTLLNKAIAEAEAKK